MALNPKLSNAAANAEVDALSALLNGGSMEIYDGAQPANANTAVTTQVLLAVLTFGSPAFGAGVAGVATANAITKDSDANATGTATWYRLKTSGGATVMDGSVGVSGANLNFATVSIVLHAEVLVDTFALTASLG